VLLLAREHARSGNEEAGATFQAVGYIDLTYL